MVVVLLELVWGEEDVGDGLRNEFLSGFFEGVAFLEDEPEGEGHFFWFLFFFGCLLLLGLNWEAVSMIPVDYAAMLEEMIWP